MSQLQKTIPLLPQGSLVMYENDGSPLLALVVGFKKEKYTLFNERSREIELASNRMYELPGRGPGASTTQAERMKYLEGVRREAEERMKTFSVSEIWDFVNDEPRDYSDKELSILYFGNAELTDLLAVRLSLLIDRVYFKRNRNLFEPRSPLVIEELKKAEEAKSRKQQAAAASVDFIRQRLKDHTLPIPPETQPLITILEEFAAHGSGLDGPRQKEATEFLTLVTQNVQLQLGGQPEDQAFKLLVAIGHFNRDTNLSIIRHKPILTWTDEVIEEAKKLIPPTPESDPSRLDLTAKRVITIDDETTRDMDDGLSVEYTNDGYLLSVHITDVASVVPYDSILDREAKYRATSIYCPDQTINMFPNEVAEDKLSLVENEVRPVMSCLFELDRDYKVVSGKIEAAFVKIAKRYSYNQADELLHDGEPELTLLYNIASALEEERIRVGGHRIEKREALVYPTPDGGLKLVEIDETSPARNLVGEMMILCNKLIANYAALNDFPVPFRGQEQPDEQPEPDVPVGPALDYALRSRLKRSTVSLTPSPHATLGLDAYTQASSPIRRYLDLCTQRQVLHHLKSGTPFFSREQFEQIMAEVEQPLSIASAVGKESKRYWTLRYLEERAKHNPTITGTIIRLDQRATVAELEEVYVPALVKGSQKVKLGDVVQLKIVRVDPKNDYMRLEVV